MTDLAPSTSTPPAAVSRTTACDRSKTRTPYSASKPETRFTSAGVETESRAAAREKLPSSAAATSLVLVLMSTSFNQGLFFVALALLGFSFGALLVI